MAEGMRIDVRGMTCSDAVVRLHRAITPLPEGSAVFVTANDEGVVADLRKYAQRVGHRWGGERRLPDGAVECEVHRGD